MNNTPLQSVRIICFLSLALLGCVAKADPMRFIALGDLPYRAKDEELTMP